MERNKLSQFTETEKQFAEKNHNIVYSFLNRYKYNVSEHYHIAVWGYLKAVQAYRRNEEFQKKYDFGYIAWRYMQTEMRTHFDMENAKKRKPEQGFVSLDADYTESENLHNCISGNCTPVEEVIAAGLLELVLENLSDRQREITCLKVGGYSNSEVAVLLEIPRATYYKELGRIRVVVENILR